MKNNHKKLIASIALVGTMAAGGTFALLQTTTNTAVNNFTSNQKISGILYEDNLGDKFVDRTTKADDETQETHTIGGIWKDYLPTQTQKKDPTIKIYKSSVPAYVGMKVTFKINDEVVSKEEFENRIAKIDKINDNWTEIGDTKDNYYFYSYSSKVENGAVTDPLFNSVTINKKIYADKDKTEEVTGNLPGFEIKVDGYAVQAAGEENDHDGDLLALAGIK